MPCNHSVPCSKPAGSLLLHVLPHHFFLSASFFRTIKYKDKDVPKISYKQIIWNKAGRWRHSSHWNIYIHLSTVPQAMLSKPNFRPLFYLNGGCSNATDRLNMWHNISSSGKLLYEPPKMLLISMLLHTSGHGDLYSVLSLNAAAADTQLTLRLLHRHNVILLTLTSCFSTRSVGKQKLCFFIAFLF